MKYAIFFQARSGSSNLCTRLNKPEQGVVNGFEIISKQSALLLNLLNPEELRHFGPEAKRVAVERFYQMYTNAACVGFKVAPYQIRDDLTGFFQYVQNVCDKIIFLYRVNFVRVAISQLWSIERAKQRLGAKLVKGELNTVARIYVNPQALDFYLLDAILERETIRTLCRLQRDALAISYEELYAEGGAGFDRVLQYLDIPRELAAETDLVRIHSDDLSNHIENFDEVLRVIGRYGCDESFLISRPGEAHDALVERALCPDVSSRFRLDGIATSTVHQPEGSAEWNSSLHTEAQGRTLQEQLALTYAFSESLSVALVQRQRELNDALLQLQQASERAGHAEAYNESLLSEAASMAQLHDALRREAGARERERDAAIAELKGVRDAMVRAHAYNESLLDEQGRLLEALEQEREARAEESRHYEASLAGVLERATRAEACCELLRAQLAAIGHVGRG